MEEEEAEGRPGAGRGGAGGDDSSEWEEYTDSSDGDDIGDQAEAGGVVRMKPVFVRTKDRVTIQEKQLDELKAKQLETVHKKNAEERRVETLKVGGW